MKNFILLFLAFSFSLQAQETLYINQVPSPFLLSAEKSVEINHLQTLLSDDVSSEDHDQCLHIIKEILEGGKLIRLTDDSLWLVNWRSRVTVIKWQPEDRLKLYQKNDSGNNFQLDNVQRGENVLATVEQKPQINLSHFVMRHSNSIFDADNESKLILDNGLIFKGPRVAWGVRDAVFIFYSSSVGAYDIWNLSKNKTISNWKLVGNEKAGSSESIFNVEKRLNQLVLGQQEVIKKISSSLFNCWAGLQDPQRPLGVFLFLGPTGVGKTELTKAITYELYKNPKRLIRFDMSQFVTHADYTRLIGAPPGYINHEEGGQLTEAIKSQPQSIVLLDEMEKAHPAIQKAFLPIFDEGYIADSQNNKIKCNRVIFIMTGNICSQEIARLFNSGYEAEEVLQRIEPTIIEHLSPELYNRVQPLIFRPITPEFMEALVEQKLKEVIERLKNLKGIELIIDDSAKKYLIEQGFHPTLGARPLKRLIENKIIAALSYAIISEGIPNGCTITIFYSEEDDLWRIDWAPSA